MLDSLVNANAMWLLVNDGATIRPRIYVIADNRVVGYFSVPTGFCRDAEHATQNRDVWSPDNRAGAMRVSIVEKNIASGGWILILGSGYG